MKFTDETLKRALRTFIQTFLATACADIALVASTELNGRVIAYSVIIPAVATALAAVMNLEAVEESTDD